MTVEAPFLNAEEEQDVLDRDQEPVFQNLYDLSDTEKDDELHHFREQYNDAREFMETLYPAMKRNYKKYRSIAEPLVDKITGQRIKGRANLFIPYPWAIVESEMPRLAGRLPRIHAFPRKSIDKKKVEMIQDNLYYTFDRMDFIQKQVLWLRQFAIYGWSPLYGFWREETRKVFERQMDEEGNQTLQRVEKTVWDDFDCLVLDCWDSFMQPGVEDLVKGDWFIARFWWSDRDILNRVKAKLFYPEIADYLKDNSVARQVQDDEGRRDRDELVGFQRNLRKHSYGNREVTFRFENERLSVMIDRAIIARVGDNPHPMQQKPIINANLMPLVSEPVGISTIDQLAGLPDKLNALENASLDNIALLIQKLFLARRYAQTDWNTLRATPGNIILTENINNDVKELPISDGTIAADRQALNTKEEMQFTAGVSDFIVGSRTSARLNDTATGVSTIVREANARFALKLAAFESGSLRPLVEMAHAYNMTYQPKEKMIYVHGPEGYRLFTVTIEDIMYECLFAIEPGSSVPLDQLTRRDALLNYAPTARLQPQIIDQRKYALEVLRSLDIRNAEDMLIPVPEVLSPAEDMQLVEAENIALLQGQDIELKGNDQLHTMYHTELTKGEPYRAATDQVRARIDDHIQAHLKRTMAQQAQALAAGQNQLFGGGPQGGPPNLQLPATAGAALPGAAPGGGSPGAGGGLADLGGPPALPPGTSGLFG